MIFTRKFLWTLSTLAILSYQSAHAMDTPDAEDTAGRSPSMLRKEKTTDEQIELNLIKDIMRDFRIFFQKGIVTPEQIEDPKDLEEELQNRIIYYKKYKVSNEEISKILNSNPEKIEELLKEQERRLKEIIIEAKKDGFSTEEISTVLSSFYKNYFLLSEYQEHLLRLLKDPVVSEALCSYNPVLRLLDTSLEIFCKIDDDSTNEEISMLFLKKISKVSSQLEDFESFKKNATLISTEWGDLITKNHAKLFEKYFLPAAEKERNDLILKQEKETNDLILEMDLKEKRARCMEDLQKRHKKKEEEKEKKEKKEEKKEEKEQKKKIEPLYDQYESSLACMEVKGDELILDTRVLKTINEEVLKTINGEPQKAIYKESQMKTILGEDENNLDSGDLNLNPVIMKKLKEDKFSKITIKGNYFCPFSSHSAKKYFGNALINIANLKLKNLKTLSLDVYYDPNIDEDSYEDNIRRIERQMYLWASPFRGNKDFTLQYIKTGDPLLSKKGNYVLFEDTKNNILNNMYLKSRCIKKLRDALASDKRWKGVEERALNKKKELPPHEYLGKYLISHIITVSYKKVEESYNRLTGAYEVEKDYTLKGDIPEISLNPFEKNPQTVLTPSGKEMRNHCLNLELIGDLLTYTNEELVMSHE